MAKLNNKKGSIAILGISFTGIVATLLLEPMAQDPTYHNFIDQRTILGVPNFWNVVSNLPFLLVGLLGLYEILVTNKAQINNKVRIAYTLFFSGVMLVAFGSVYYHLWPDNNTLVWDRLPMAIAFMALFAIVIGEFIASSLGRLMLLPLITFGAVSVFYWHWSEANGAGDLRLYILVQFLPMLLIPAILWFFKSSFTHVQGYWLLLCAYLLAKVFEHYDEAIYHFLQLISGHSMKHLMAAMGVWLLLRSYTKRQQI